MAEMTEEEADALDDLLTCTTPKLGPNGTGFFSRKGMSIVPLDEATARILTAEAMAAHQTPSELIATMVRQRLAASAS
jgi:hypothetical protein